MDLGETLKRCGIPVEVKRWVRESVEVLMAIKSCSSFNEIAGFCL